MGKRGVLPVFIFVKLGKYQIPKFHISVAVTARLTIFLAAAVGLASVKIKLGAGPAGTGADFPEIVLFSQADNALLGNADFIMPNIKGFLIVFVNGDPNPLLRQIQMLCHKFPGPGNRFFFEIIPKREIAQHFKKSGVAGGMPYIFNIACSNTLLAGAHPL